MKRILYAMILFLFVMLLLYIADDKALFDAEEDGSNARFLLPTTIAAEEHSVKQDDALSVNHDKAIEAMNEATVIEDKNEGVTPDFRKILIAYDKNIIYISLSFHDASYTSSSWVNIFLNGKKRDTVYVTPTSFVLRRDRDNNGYYETIVYKGRVVKVADQVFSLEIPLQKMPDIALKKIWAYSLDSQDRIPDVGVLVMNDGLF